MSNVTSHPAKEGMNGLLPCPFCGSENVCVEPLVGGFVVDCQDCGGGCGTCYSENAAREEWNKRSRSIQPEWCLTLALQQQSVLFLAARGPDGVAKNHPCKRVQRAYRGTVLRAAKYARCLKYGEKGDNFMCLQEFANDRIWAAVIQEFFATADSLPHHFYMHLLHGAQIVGYKHPLPVFRERWLGFYRSAVNEFHLNVETMKEMDARLSDWDQEFWQ